MPGVLQEKLTAEQFRKWKEEKERAHKEVTEQCKTLWAHALDFNVIPAGSHSAAPARLQAAQEAEAKRREDIATGRIPLEELTGSYTFFREPLGRQVCACCTRVVPEDHSWACELP